MTTFEIPDKEKKNLQPLSFNGDKKKKQPTALEVKVSRWTAEKVRQWRRVWERAEEWNWGPGKRNTLSPQTHPAGSPLLCSSALLVLKYWFCHLFYWPLKLMSAYRICVWKNPVWWGEACRSQKIDPFSILFQWGNLHQRIVQVLAMPKLRPCSHATTGRRFSLFFPAL